MKLIDVLVALLVVGVVGAALGGLLLSATGMARNAAVDGRRAELAQQAMDRSRAGLAASDSAATVAEPGGESYEAVAVRRDDVAPGALEVTVRALAGGRPLVFGAARDASAVP